MPKNASLPLWKDKNSDQKVDTLLDLVMDLYAYTLSEKLQKTIDLLDQYEPVNDAEKQYVQTIKDMIRKYPNIMSRSCEPGHLIGNALILDLEKGRILLHFHKRLGKWLQFGGHGDYETEYALVALRKAREETGLTDLKFFPDEDHPKLMGVDVHTIPATNEVPEHLHLDLRFLLYTKEPEKVFEVDAKERRKPGESDRFKWLSFEEANEVPILDDLMRLIKRAEIEYKKYLETKKRTTRRIKK